MFELKPTDENIENSLVTNSFELGGYTQKVLIEGKSKNLPIVIVLHGVPRTPIPFPVHFSYSIY